MLKNPDECNLGYSTAYRNFIYIDDLLDAWNTVITHRDCCKNQIFTVGPDRPVQIKQHAENIAALLNWSGKINWDTKPKRPGEIYLLNSNYEKLFNLTGWVPTVSYTDGLTKTIATWKNIFKGENYDIIH
jgi:nucleoside-diphosphate-sugar epimerase